MEIKMKTTNWCLFLYICHGCHDLTMLCLNITDIATATVKDIDDSFIVHDISKSEAIHLLENTVLENLGIYKNTYQK